MKIIVAAALLALSLAGCSGSQVASFGVETVARGVVGKIDNDGGLFGVNTSTIINTPEQQAQKARDAALKQQYPLASGGDKGTIIVNQGGSQAGGYAQQPEYAAQPYQGGGYGGYGGGYGYGYGPPSWAYDRGW